MRVAAFTRPTRGNQCLSGSTLRIASIDLCGLDIFVMSGPIGECPVIERRFAMRRRGPAHDGAKEQFSGNGGRSPRHSLRQFSLASWRRLQNGDGGELLMTAHPQRL